PVVASTSTRRSIGSTGEPAEASTWRGEKTCRGLARRLASICSTFCPLSRSWDQAPSGGGPLCPGLAEATPGAVRPHARLRAAAAAAHEEPRIVRRARAVLRLLDILRLLLGPRLRTGVRGAVAGHS